MIVSMEKLLNTTGVAEKNAQTLNKSLRFLTYLLTSIRRFFMKMKRLFAKAPDYELARTILGKDFISPEKIMNLCRSITYTSKQLAKFRKTIPLQEILEWCRDNSCMLVAGPNRPMSLFDICAIKKNCFYSGTGRWYFNQKFFQEDKVETRWYIICKSSAPESIYKNWEEQEVLISNIETVPNAAEFTWAIIAYKAVRGVYLFSEISVRTLSLDLYGNHISIGKFSSKGLLITNNWNTECSPFLGLSVARRQRSKTMLDHLIAYHLRTWSF